LIRSVHYGEIDAALVVPLPGLVEIELGERDLADGVVFINPEGSAEYGVTLGLELLPIEVNEDCRSRPLFKGGLRPGFGGLTRLLLLPQIFDFARQGFNLLGRIVFDRGGRGIRSAPLFGLLFDWLWSGRVVTGSWRIS